MRWQPNEEMSELVITAEKPRLEAIEQRPHITCVLGAARWSGLGFDQMQSIKVGTGERTHTDLVPMTISYHCQAKEGLVARRIAWNSSLYTSMLRRVIMRAGGLHQVDVKHDIGPESALTAYTGPVAESELVSVVVTVPFYWQPQWRIRRSAEIWNRLELELCVGAAQARVSPGATIKLRPPHVNGQPVTTIPLESKPPAFKQKVIVCPSEGEE